LKEGKKRWKGESWLVEDISDAFIIFSDPLGYMGTPSHAPTTQKLPNKQLRPLTTEMGSPGSDVPPHFPPAPGRESLRLRQDSVVLFFFPYCLWVCGQGIRSHHYKANRWGNNGNSVRLYIFELQNHCRW